MLTALGDTAFLAWSPLFLATALLFGVYLRARSGLPAQHSVSCETRRAGRANAVPTREKT
ncbi:MULTISPECIES: hypothetical protein [unclassified Roseibium]|uniref:hypothetical protein n=1 Tax=unclassified Roseibium TaxID=2629323 RepID=UPI0031820275